MFNMILDGESKPTTMDEIENNWIIEHARQVDILKICGCLCQVLTLKQYPVVLPMSYLANVSFAIVLGRTPMS